MATDHEDSILSALKCARERNRSAPAGTVTRPLEAGAQHAAVPSADQGRLRCGVSARLRADLHIQRLD